MLNLSSATRVFVALAPVDLRGSFNRLAALTQSILAQDPLSGHWFVFINRRQPAQASVVGRFRPVGLRQAIGERALHLAARRRALRTPARGGADRPAYGMGGAGKTGLVSPLKRARKYFQKVLFA